jgi:capsid portal protein
LVERTFNQFAQLNVNSYSVSTWFKEFGDPRVCSRTTGEYYADLDAFYAKEWEDRSKPRPLAATEILVIRQAYGGSAVYGMTAAAGLYPDLVGSRDLAEENQKAVADENIPSLMLLVGGGTIAQRSYERIKEALQERKKGRKSILVIEANSSKTGYAGGPSVQPTLHVERMKAEQTSDAMFTNYDARVEEKTDGAYRFPRVALGKDKGANRAVADYMGRFVQNEVYGPRRTAKDEIINTVFFPEWGITLWKYTTPATKPRDPKVLADILKTLTEGAILSPNEAREEAGTIFNRHLEDLQGLWTRLPPRIMTALLQTKNKELAGILAGRDPQALEDLSSRLKELIAIGGDGSSSESTDLE